MPDPDSLGLFVEYGGLSCFSSSGGTAIGGFFGALVVTILSHVNVGIESQGAIDPAAVIEDAAIVAAEMAGVGLAVDLAGCSTPTPAPRLASPLMDCHHLVPEAVFKDKKYKRKLDKARYRLDQGNAIEIPRNLHTRKPDGVHTGSGGPGGRWNKEVKDWLDGVDDPTYAMIEEFVKGLAFRMGLGKYYKKGVKYYNRKAKKGTSKCD